MSAAVGRITSAGGHWWHMAKIKRKQQKNVFKWIDWWWVANI